MGGYFPENHGGKNLDSQNNLKMAEGLLLFISEICRDKLKGGNICL